MVGYWKLWTVNLSQRNSKRHRVSQMLLLTWVFIQPLFPPYKWLWCFEHSSVRFLIGFCFETSFKKTSPYSNLKPQQARIPSSRNKPLQEQLLPLSIVHNQQQLRQDLKKEMEIYKYNQNQASWTQKPLIPSSIVNPYQQNKRNCKRTAIGPIRYYNPASIHPPSKKLSR